MARFQRISTRGRAVTLVVALSGAVLGAGMARSLTPAVAATATATTLTAAPASVVTGGSVSLTARVTAGGAVPTGTVTFFEDGAALPVRTLGAGKNSASSSVKMTTPGVHAFTAKYNGSAAFAPSPLSNAASVTVGQAGGLVATMTLLSSIGTSMPSGTPLTLSAKLTPSAGGPPVTGTVSFANGATTLSSGRTIANNAATLPLPSLPLGTNTITAAYGGAPGSYAPATATLAITVTPTGNDKYLQHLYTDLLGMQDPNGEAYWSAQLTKGMPRYQLAYAFTQTPQYRGMVVSTLYTNEMGRPASADPSGAAYWTDWLRTHTAEQLAASLVGSDEKFVDPNFGKNDVATYVNAVYQALLGRSDANDPSGTAYWQNFLLTGGPRWQMTLDFVAGPEWATKTVNTEFAQYHLGTPDAGGLGYWVGQLQGGMKDDQLAANLVSSPAYVAWAQAN